MKKAVTLKKKFIFTSFLSILLSLIAICIISYAFLGSMALQFAHSRSEDAVRQKSEDIKTRISSVETTVLDLIYNRDMQRLLTEKQESEDYYIRNLEISRIISRATNALSMTDNIAVFSSDGQMLGSMFEIDLTKPIQDYPWYEQAAQSTGDTIWLMDTANIVKDTYGHHIAIDGVKKIRSIYASDNRNIGENLGYVYLTLNLDSLLHFGEPDLSKQGRHIYVVDENGRILGGSDNSHLGEILLSGSQIREKDGSFISLQGKNYLMTSSAIDGPLELFVVQVTDRDIIFQDAYTAIAICILASVVLLVVLGYYSVQNANALSHPLHLLEREFEKVEQGEFDDLISEPANILEINNLFERFGVMANRLDTLIHQVYEAELKEQKLIGATKQAQLQSLQMQINPHFLYNTLDSINWMALMEGNEDVSKMILALGHLFRSNMDREHIFTTAREEIEQVRLYMYLEQVRFGGRLDYEITAADEIMDTQMLKHMLQPLVENSIKYGIEPYDCKGHIHISFNHADETMKIQVSDNGQGMKEETLRSLRNLWEEIHTEEERKEDAGNGGVGIRNIMKRLKLCYGDQVQFLITSDKEHGTCIEIVFPYYTKSNS